MGPNDKEDVSSKKPISILAKIGNTVSGVGGFLGRDGKALGYGIIYPIQPKNWFKSFGEMRHDIKNGWNYVIGNPTEEYDPPIETTQASKNLGIKIISHKDGKIKFLASKTLTGDIPYLTPEQLGKIEELNKKNKYSSIAIFKEENKVVIEVDVKEITNNIKNDPEHKGKSPEEIKRLVLKGIYGEVDRNLKDLAGIIGGELERHTDRKLLHGIAEKLYKEYDSRLSETAVPKKPSNTMNSSETVKGTDDEKHFGITNPNDFPFGKETISPIKSMRLLQDVKEQAEGLEGAVNFKDVPPGEKIESPLTSAIRNEKGEGKREEKLRF
ncbi:hypothetical protein [Wolbachia endosymbiont of Cimex lectularius]|uniref:hypothetical protein n=1 Tax=Wolbachia endosymbiont of Cimex lectularius TaxID=246273 RepID=UPI00049A3332|nr:hypothetical protein [Wolbachia endosymbiont of Cimex lectularius]BAO99852.1 putative uncharacterized protein [Wolbachia endosymbiont of Cimex lectularius]